jgi:hypothetical protein
MPEFSQILLCPFGAWIFPLLSQLPSNTALTTPRGHIFTLASPGVSIAILYFTPYFTVK